MNQHQLAALQPKIIWDLFLQISKIPRRSKHEEKIREWVKKWASQNQLAYKADSIGNLLLIKSATDGNEDYPGIIIQGHLDMVAQKIPASNHNFETDPIPLLVKEDFVTADGTTLGADNGIGVAMALAALIDPNINHGPLEVLLTVDEETGLTGAFGLEPGFFSHKLLLNLDSEDEGEITISSAGGGGTQIKLPFTRKTIDDSVGFKIEVKGLHGGHSGVDINKSRQNAIKLLTEGLKDLEKLVSFSLVDFSGGNAHNAIPRDAYAEIIVNSDEEKTFNQYFKKWKENLEKYRDTEPSIELLYQKIAVEEGISETSQIVKLLPNLPHGVLALSNTIPDLVETSNNLAEVTTHKNEIEIALSTRSSVDDELKRVPQEIKSIAEKFNAFVVQEETYPGWEPDLNSPFLHLVHREYEKTYNNKVKLRATHGGLETGLLKGVDPELHCVSIGPEIKDPHSPSERVYIKSVAMIWDVVKLILTNVNSIVKEL
jgi:dipeptidase D